MTRDQLDAIRARVDGATRGPWEAVTPKRYAAVRSDAEGCYVYTQGKIPADTHPDTVARQQRDAQFIAAARQDVPTLLAEVERLTAERDAAFKRGVAAMREAAATYLDSSNHAYYADGLRALPDPKDTP